MTVRRLTEWCGVFARIVAVILVTLAGALVPVRLSSSASIPTPGATSRSTLAEPARTRTHQASEADGPTIDVVSQTPWVKPDGTFLLTADVRDAPLGARVGITLHTQAVANRNAFTRTLFGVGLGGGTIKVPSIPLDTVPPSPDGSRRITVAIALRQRLAGTSGPGQYGVARGLAGEGAYPLELDLVSQDGGDLSRVVTHVVRLPAPDEHPARLRAAVLLGIHAPPTIAASGRDTSTPSTFRSADDLADVLAALPDVPLTLDPTPETIEALGRSSPESRKTVATLARSLAGRQVLDSPYVELPVTSWINAGLADEPLDLERARGNRILSQLLTPATDGSTWISDPYLTTAAVAKLWRLGVRHIVIRPDALAPTGPARGSSPSGGETLARPFSLATPPDSPTTAVAVDIGLQQAFTRQADPELTAYQVLAELAVIEQEDPRSERGVVLEAPQDWQTSAGFLTTLLTGLADHPLLEPVTIDDLFRDVKPLRSAAGNSGQPVMRNLAPLPPADLTGYAKHLTDLRKVVTSYTGMVGTGDPLIAQWDQRMLISGSTDLSPSESSAYLKDIGAYIAKQVTAIDAPARQTVTLTAANADIPLTLRSRLTQPVDVMVALDSGSRLEFPNGDRIRVKLKPGAQRVSVPVRTRSPGDTPLTIRVVSPDGELALAGTEITVRSTAVSGIGYVLSVGAVLFLIVWWARNWRQTIRHRRQTNASDL